MKLLSIHLPSNKPQFFRRLVENLVATAADPTCFEIVVKIDTGDEAMSFQVSDLCGTAGLLIVAVGPWVPGGASVLGAGRPILRSGMEGAAAFIPLTVCTVSALGYALAPLADDPVPLLVGGLALLGLWARQICLPSRTTGRDD